jgi:hypothetical protein
MGVNPSAMSTPDLLNWAAKFLRNMPGGREMADELALRAARLGELEYQAAPDRNDLTGQTPAQIIATVNAPSPT